MDLPAPDPQVVVLVPRRPDFGERDALWAACRPRWDAIGQVIEGEHLTGPFNRAMALNRAAHAAGPWDVAVIADSDVMIEHDQVRRAIELAHDTQRVVMPHTVFMPLGLKGTERAKNGLWPMRATDCRQPKESTMSSVVVVPRTVWERTGGFDERFEGWGYEDVAFFLAADTLTGSIQRIEGPVWHLQHAHSPERNPRTREFRASKERSARYRAAYGDVEAIRGIMREDGGPLSSTGHSRIDAGRVVVLVARREGKEDRDAIWRFLKPHWEKHGWQVFEGHDDTPGRPFNLSKARNNAARAAGDWDVAILIDADVYVPNHQLHRAVILAHDSNQCAFPHTQWYGTSEAGREAILNGDVPFDWRVWDTAVTPSGEPVIAIREPLSHSACMVVPRPLWDTVGGYDERFEGWGGEDWGFFEMVFACGGRGGGVQRLNEPIWHFHHEVTEESRLASLHQENDNLAANHALGRRYLDCRRDPARLLRLRFEGGVPAP